MKFIQSEKLKQMKAVATGRPAVLFVDDETQSTKIFTRAFEQDFRIFTATSAAEAQELLASLSDEVGVMITDQRMPRQTGVQLLDFVKVRYPHVVRLLTTAYADLDDAVAAVNRGEIFRYILKPWDLKNLRAALTDAMTLYLRQRTEKDLLLARRQTIMSLASHIVHELSTPLAAIYTAVASIKEYLPELVQGYRRGVEAGLCDEIPEPMLELMETTPTIVLSMVGRTNMLIRLLLMNAAENAKNRTGYRLFPMRQSIEDALKTYPFKEGENSLVSLEGQSFEAFGSGLLMNYVIYNLLKNSLDAIREAGKGYIRIRMEPGTHRNRLYFRDTGTGISPQVMPHIFEEFYSAKGVGQGTGMGLSFCRKVLDAFGGDIECRSTKGEYTELVLTFPKAEEELDATIWAEGDMA